MTRPEGTTRRSGRRREPHDRPELSTKQMLRELDRIGGGDPQRLRRRSAGAIRALYRRQVVLAR